MEKEIITKKEEEKQPLKNFAKKQKVAVPQDILNEQRIIIPPIYYWEDVEGGVSSKMTMAFKYKEIVFGLSYEIEDDNVVRKNMMRQKLFNTVKESLDVLVHHGTKILDSFGNIDPRLVNEQEAIRFKYDKYWKMKVAAFNELVRIAPITRAKAKELKLL